MNHAKEIWIPDESGMYILACNPNDNHGYVAVEIRGWGSLSKLGKEEAERVLRDRAIRLAALWNTAEDLWLTTEEIKRGAISKMFWLAGNRIPQVDMIDMEFMVPIRDDEIEFHPWKGEPIKVSVRGGEHTKHVRDEIMRRWNKCEVAE